MAGIVRAASWAAMLALCGAALAGTLEQDALGAIVRMQAHRRIAIGYLRTGNAELAEAEIGEMRDGLARDGAALAGRDAGLDAALAHAGTALAAAGRDAPADPDVARRQLQDSTRDLDSWRRGRGLRLFSDCVAEIGQAYARLDRFRAAPPGLGRDGAEVEAAARSVLAEIARCDEEAGPSRRAEPEFRRLVDGWAASLRQVPEAVARRDPALLHRLLIEQLSFAGLLAFRFG